MRISIASYSFHSLKSAGVMDAFGYLESCRYRYGLSTADFWNGILGPDELVWDPTFQKKIVEGLAERELTLVNYHVDGCHIWEDDPAKRQQHYENAMKHLAAGAAMGAKTMRIDAGSRAEKWTGEQFEHIVKRYREYAKFAADHGFVVGPENHWGPETNVGEMERLLKAVDHPAFGLLLHLGRWSGEGAAEADARVAKWAFHTHVSPKLARDGQLEPAVRMLLKGGYKGCFGVEHGERSNAYAVTGAAVAEVRRVLEAIRLEGAQ